MLMRKFDAKTNWFIRIEHQLNTWCKENNKGYYQTRDTQSNRRPKVTRKLYLTKIILKEGRSWKWEYAAKSCVSDKMIA